MTRAAMPETSVHKQGNALPLPYEIWRAMKARSAPPASKAVLAEQAHESLLGARVARASHERHNCGPSLGIKNVRHDQ